MQGCTLQKPARRVPDIWELACWLSDWNMRTQSCRLHIMSIYASCCVSVDLMDLVHTGVSSRGHAPACLPLVLPLLQPHQFFTVRVETFDLGLLAG